MYLPNAAKHLMLDAMDESIATGWKFGSLHTAYSTTGTNELTGGSPAYARKGLTWAAASAGAKALAATLPTWDVPASTTVRWIGLWDAVTVGTFLGMVPAGGGTIKPASSEATADLTSDLVNSKAHGLAAGDYVVFWGTLPTGLAVGTLYQVRTTGLTTDAFTVTTEGSGAGGTVVDLTGTAPLNFFLQRVVPEAFVGQGTYAASSLSVDLGAVA